MGRYSPVSRPWNHTRLPPSMYSVSLNIAASPRQLTPRQNRVRAVLLRGSLQVHMVAFTTSSSHPEYCARAEPSSARVATVVRSAIFAGVWAAFVGWTGRRRCSRGSLVPGSRGSGARLHYIAQKTPPIATEGTADCLLY